MTKPSSFEPQESTEIRPALHVVKVGGAVVDDEDRLLSLLDQFAAMPGAEVLVHGGGREATRLAAALGLETHMVDGRRITDQDMLRVVTMVYGGLVNKHIVALLQARKVNAIGLTGADLGLISAHRRGLKDGVDYGFVGDVDRVDASALSQLIHLGATPVVAPLTHDGLGTLLNTNADTIASAVACALAPSFSVTLTYCFERPGVLLRPDDDRSAIRELSLPDFQRLKSEGIIAGGMIPKLENAFQALASGVERVVITEAGNISGEEGTTIK